MGTEGSGDRGDKGDKGDMEHGGTRVERGEGTPLDRNRGPARFGCVGAGCFGVLGVMCPRMSCCWWKQSGCKAKYNAKSGWTRVTSSACCWGTPRGDSALTTPAVVDLEWLTNPATCFEKKQELFEKK